MASMSQSKLVTELVNNDICFKGQVYKNLQFYLLEDVCADVILGLRFQEKHKSVTFTFGGKKPPIEVGGVEVCGLTTLNIEPPSLFGNILPDCKPIAVKSRRYSQVDKEFIRDEVQRLLKEDIIEPSTSPWRAQVVVTKEGGNHKKRLVVDYSQTINRYTQLDAYPLPRIDINW